ncbi:vWA domain-containing protein [Methylovulum psychrotolerans]|uniref:Peptidase n=1 Tax=Methylovulum psychrotolerans TaxID=1704499 RepID=A0A1Z4BWW9_9GAMM|nr:peptidase [Methylovulum psychrotolerans]ASF45775.1 peptidase [Methylovulum psychrotolerans]
MSKKPDPADNAKAARETAIGTIRNCPVLIPLVRHLCIGIDMRHQFVAETGWLALSPNGHIYLHPKRRAAPEEWARLIAIAAVCLGFSVVRRRDPQAIWELAALLVANRFCDDLKIGRLPEAFNVPLPTIPAGGEETLFRILCVEKTHPQTLSFRDNYCGAGRMVFCGLDEKPDYRSPSQFTWQSLLAEGIAQGAGQALELASGNANTTTNRPNPNSPAQKAKRRLIDHHPLLGALAAGFDVEESIAECRRYDIQVAAIDVGARKIWMNAAVRLSPNEALFVFAHELLHAGLNHASRRRGRDAFLWNAACDFVINGWLKAMNLGTPPTIGMLYDPEFSNCSAEEIYDRLAQDIRRARKLATLRGLGQCDFFGETQQPAFTDAESYCRRALAQGLERCQNSGRGLLPAGLVEAIRSLNQPPIPWDVQLADWFDRHFPSPEYRRSYARPSRRQAATPTIPRPSTCPPPEEQRKSRVFGVVLDTSGSMEPQLLGKALGAIASYAIAREVFAVRLICCDAAAYDSGWIEPERLLDRFMVKGRGGTALQPGVDALRDLASKGDFPRLGPVLIITDGGCENHLDISFSHAYLLPEGKRLPFTARGDVFSVK